MVIGLWLLVIASFFALFFSLLLRYCSLLFVTASLLFVTVRYAFVTVRYCSLRFRYLLRYSPLLCRFYNVKKMQILQTLKKAEYSVAHASPKLGQGAIRLPPMAFPENINGLSIKIICSAF